MSIDKRIVKRIVCGSACLAFLFPAHKAEAQVGTARDLLGWLFDIPNYNVGINGGIGNYGRFLLQHPTRSTADLTERELRGLHAWTVGGEVGGTILPRVGVQLSYNFTRSDLAWRDDTGTGSELLDVNDLGDLSHSVVGLELIRYMFLENSKITPFATAGVLATWWGMEGGAQGLSRPDSETQFRWGGTGSVGLQFRLWEDFRLRLDATTATVGNPFTGRDSYIADFGRTIDEPSRVRKTDFRLGLAYTWGKPHPGSTTTNGR